MEQWTASLFALSPEWWVLALLGLAGLAAGFVDSIAGGGGIITVPALLAAGLPPHIALGTNKLQASFGSLSAALSYRARGLVTFRSLMPGIGATALGAAAGTWVVSLIQPGLLKVILPVSLGLVALFLLLRPRRKPAAAYAGSPAGPDAGSDASREAGFGLVLGAGLVLGFYDGFIGPGTGTFWVLVLMHLGHLGIQTATARTKVFNFTSNAVSLGVFLAAGTVLLVPGLVMGACQALGARIGSHVALRRGDGFIRLMLGLTTFGMLCWVIIRQSI